MIFIILALIFMNSMIFVFLAWNKFSAFLLLTSTKKLFFELMTKSLLSSFTKNIEKNSYSRFSNWLKGTKKKLGWTRWSFDSKVLCFFPIAKKINLKFRFRLNWWFCSIEGQLGFYFTEASNWKVLLLLKF